MSITDPTPVQDELDFHQVDLQHLNTLGLPCQANRLVVLSALSQLPAISQFASTGARWLVLGGASNVVLPATLDQPVLKVALTGIKLIADQADAWIIDAAAGESWHAFVSHCISQGWPGLENLALIPGSVGAAPVQNIGAYGVELNSRIESVCAWHIPEARFVTLTAQQCAFAYRDSMFKRTPPGTWVITSVRFRLPKPWQAITHYPDLARSGSLSALPSGTITARQIFELVCQIRQSKLPDPTVLGNAGSFFKNPVVSAAQFESIRQAYPDLVGYPQDNGLIKLAAAWLIDQAGWKGQRRGRAGVHERQALVIVNEGGATAADILNLANEIVASVQDRYGVQLEMEPTVIQ